MNLPLQFSSFRATLLLPVFLAACLAFGGTPSRLAAQDPGSVPSDVRSPTANVAPSQTAPPADNRPYTQNPAPRTSASAPSTLVLPAGTMLSVRTTEWISSDNFRPGDTFAVTLEQPVVVDGWVVARRGQMAVGAVAVAKKAGRIHGVSQLGVHLAELTLVDGQQLSVDSQLAKYSGGTSNGRDALAVGTTTGVGALIGAAADGGAGAGIGAGAGAVAGLIGVLSTRGRPTVILPESLLTFRTTTPLTISTAKSQPAFRPVSQSDYGNRNTYSRPGPPSLARRGYANGYPPLPYYSYAYGPYPYYGYGYPYYPPFYFGFSTFYYGGHGYYGYHGYRGHGGFYGRH
jgi:hypothetical protein